MKPTSADSTPTVGSATDVAPLGRNSMKPEHERTADEDIDVAEWERVAAMAEFKALLAAKVKFIAPATIFFVVYYFALPVLVGYAPLFMETKVLGELNLAYLFALSQFFMAWILAALYLRAAGRFDDMAKRLLAKIARK